jgi:hypothetical protein
LSPLKCSLHTNDHTFVVSASSDDTDTTSRLEPDVSSLSVLRLHGGDFQAVPILSCPQDPLYRDLLRIRGVAKRLRRSFAHVQGAAGLSLFVKRCDCLFAELGKILRQQKQQQEQHISKDMESVEFEWLISQLSEVEETSIADLSEDCRHVTMTTQDSRNRTLSIRLDLSNKGGLHGAVDAFFPPEKKDTTRKRPRDDVPASLAALHHDFCDRVGKFGPLFDELDEMDAYLVVLDPPLPCARKHAHRRIKISTTASIVVTLDVHNPRQLPFIRWIVLGSTGRSTVEDTFQADKWERERSVRENLKLCLGATELPTPSKQPEHDGNECGICFSDLWEDETTTRTEMVDISCERESCGRVYHSHCLRKWLESLASSRVSFDRLLGVCPYCKAEPISVKMNQSRF